MSALRALGLPREQLNDRSALTLLALLDLRPNQPWSQAMSPQIGVTPIMEFALREYKAEYAPNSRETFRRFTLHQFVQAGLVVANPDDASRPTNSPKYCYQITPDALTLLKLYGSKPWDKALKVYQIGAGTLANRYAQVRKMAQIPLKIGRGRKIRVSPGGQNVLVAKIVDQFCPRFAPGGLAVYVGDTGEKWAHYDEAYLLKLGVEIDSHGKMPDVVVHFTKRNWLLLIEAVTSHGPVTPKRLAELRNLFSGSTAGLVFITAFLDRATMLKYLRDIAWETEVWVAESPDHLIHFNGERFLGPYPT